MAEREPVDPRQCQADIITYNAFRFGPPYQSRRCEEAAVWIATENEPAGDGTVGSMSLCSVCRERMEKQLGSAFATFTPAANLLPREELSNA